MLFGTKLHLPQIDFDQYNSLSEMESAHFGLPSSSVSSMNFFNAEAAPDSKAPPKAQLFSEFPPRRNLLRTTFPPRPSRPFQIEAGNGFPLLPIRDACQSSPRARRYFPSMSVISAKTSFTSAPRSSASPHIPPRPARCQSSDYTPAVSSLSQCSAFRAPAARCQMAFRSVRLSGNAS